MFAGGLNVQGGFVAEVDPTVGRVRTKKSVATQERDRSSDLGGMGRVEGRGVPNYQGRLPH